MPATLLRAQNTLEIEVANRSANRIADLDRRSVPWKKIHRVNMPARLGAHTGPDDLLSATMRASRESGLIGPVTLTPRVRSGR